MKPKKQPKMVVKGTRQKSRLKVKGTIKLQEEIAFAKQDPQDVRIFDISELGAKIASLKNIHKNRTVALHFQTADILKPIEIKGIIRWTRPIKVKEQSFALAGVKFDKLNPKVFERVATMLVTRMMY